MDEAVMATASTSDFVAVFRTGALYHGAGEARTWR